MSKLQTGISDDLLDIYSTLRRLGYLKEINNDLPTGNKIDVSVFPKRFLLKLLDERLEDLTEFARCICEDLFKQIGGKAKKVDQKQLDQLDSGGKQTIIDTDMIRYPEFDEYFHCCVHLLYDFLIDLHWHETDIDQLTRSDFDYVTTNLKRIKLFFDARKSSDGSPAKTLADKQPQMHKVKTPKSSLYVPGKSPHGRRTSPTLRRRVRFENDQPANETSAITLLDQRKIDDRDFEEVHSILALELLVHAINIFVHQLQGRFHNWSSSVKAMLNTMLDYIFSSHEKIRAKQLELVAKRVKIYADVHLTVLDYINEIKTTYLIDRTLEVICTRDTGRILETFKKPLVAIHVQRCLEIEGSILTCLIEQCLQIFFGLLVCEINFPPVELDATLSPKSRNDATTSHENVLNFVTGWLQADDIIFGYARPSTTKNQFSRARVEKIASQIQRPRIAAKSSTLSLDGAYASSSRILAQMDNLSEFMRTFIGITSNRLRHQKQSRYFFDFIATGFQEFHKMVADKLRRPLNLRKRINSKSVKSSKSVESNADQRSLGVEETDIDSLVAKIRCLKYGHIMTSVARLVRVEAKRAEVELAGLDQLTKELDAFMKTCVGSKSIKKEVAARSINTNRSQNK